MWEEVIMAYPSLLLEELREVTKIIRNQPSG
jgi:hypothetical protein